MVVISADLSRRQFMCNNSNKVIYFLALHSRNGPSSMIIGLPHTVHYINNELKGFLFPFCFTLISTLRVYLDPSLIYAAISFKLVTIL